MDRELNATAGEIWLALDSALGLDELWADTDGVVTIADACARYDKVPQVAQRMLDKAVALGVMERGRITRLCPDGRRRCVKAYRLVVK